MLTLHGQIGSAVWHLQPLEACLCAKDQRSLCYITIASLGPYSRVLVAACLQATLWHAKMIPAELERLTTRKLSPSQSHPLQCT